MLLSEGADAGRVNVLTKLTVVTRPPEQHNFQLLCFCSCVALVHLTKAPFSANTDYVKTNTVFSNETQHSD